jgi:hypothetical protein
MASRKWFGAGDNGSNMMQTMFQAMIQRKCKCLTMGVILVNILVVVKVK